MVVVVFEANSIVAVEFVVVFERMFTSMNSGSQIPVRDFMLNFANGTLKCRIGSPYLFYDNEIVCKTKISTTYPTNFLVLLSDSYLIWRRSAGLGPNRRYC